MNKYLVLVSQELNGHASSETYYLETQKDYTLSQLYSIVFKEEIEEREIEIKHEKEDFIYGNVYGESFSMTMRNLNDIKPHTIYELYTYTG